MKISVVIPTYNRAQYLSDNFDSLVKQTFPHNKYEVIYVDDGSKDRTALSIKNFTQFITAPPVRYFLQNHGGPARARNLGIKKAKGRSIAFIDDDCLANENWLVEIQKTLDKNPQAVGVGGKTITFREKITPFTHQVENEESWSFPTCNVAYRKKILEAIGGFDSKFPFTGEDADLTWRAEKKGKIIHNPQMIVIHPPRPLSFLKDLSGMRYLEAEFFLYEKMPTEYQKRRAPHPLIEIIWFHLIKLTIKKLIGNLLWLIKNPFIFFRFLLLLVLQRLYIIILLPYFYVRHLRRKLIV